MDKVGERVLSHMPLLRVCFVRAPASQGLQDKDHKVRSV